MGLSKKAFRIRQKGTIKLTNKVAIFLNQHMPLSEVFISHQASALKRFSPTLIACRQITPSVDHSLPRYILNTKNSLPEKISEGIFKLTGCNSFLKNHIMGHDIIHAHFGPTGWLAASLSEQTKIPLIVTLHGFDVTKKTVTLKDDGLHQFLYKKYLSKVTNHASQFICVSEYLKKRAIEFGFPEEKCIVQYMGIPLFPHDQKKYSRTDKNSPFRILSVGRLIPLKGHSMLIKAVAAVQNEGYNIQLDIIGAGPLQNELEQQAANTLKSYKIWGGQPHQKILSMMRQSDIFCHLSHEIKNGSNEAFGLVALEAQWAGLPVIAFNSGGVPEAIDDGKTGILCPENDIQAVKNAIVTLINNDELRMAMSNDATNFVKNTFDNNVLTEKLESIYDEVIKNG
jgi:colanic acid/amylovoran biosynthesis glycosyltransferase